MSVYQGCFLEEARYIGLTFCHLQKEDAEKILCLSTHILEIQNFQDHDADHLTFSEGLKTTFFAFFLKKYGCLCSASDFLLEPMRITALLLKEI